MSQEVWETIDPATTSGNQLAVYLNNFKDAVVSGMSGTTKPSEIDPGGTWVDLTNDNAGAGTWDLKMWTGVVSITLMTISLSTGSVILPGSEDSFEVVRQKDDALGPYVELQKRRIAGAGQTLTSDILGELRVSGRTDGGVDILQAAIVVTASENSEAAKLGTKFAIKTAANGSGALQERISIANGNVGLNNNAPVAPLDVVGESRVTKVSDDAVAPITTFSKKRVNANGQTLAADSLGLTEYRGVDEAGVERVVASVETVCDGNTNAADRGSILSIKTVIAGSTALTEAIRIEKGAVYLYGVNQSANASYPREALAGGLGNALLSIDSATYRAFEASVFLTSIDSVEGAAGQWVSIKGVHNGTAWIYSNESDILDGDFRSIDIKFSEAGGILTIDYDNVMPNFSSGTVDKQLRRM